MSSKKTEKVQQSEKTDVAVITPENRTNVTLPQDALDLFARDAHMAPEFAPEEKAQPWLRIAQSMTPEAKRANPKFLDGLEEGMFFTVLTRRIWDGEDGLLFVPAYFTKNYTHWKPRLQGGGLLKNFDKDRAASGIDTATRNADTNKLMVGPAEVVEASMYYGFIVDPVTGDFEEALLSLQSTQLSKSRRWNSLIAAQRHPTTKRQLPIFARAYRLTTVPESKDKHNWMGIKVEAAQWITDLPNWHVIYHGATVVNEQFSKGERRLQADDAEIISDAVVESVDAEAYASAPASSSPDFDVKDDLS